ncbi:MAG: cell surface protein SprA [Imperialibacter sp.]|uniref:T9SS outer membrane translocon Sov/SprA n=1 Tax=Imperialibacter sp. TaxID=2038411 RepID=UPI0032F098A4
MCISLVLSALLANAERSFFILEDADKYFLFKQDTIPDSLKGPYQPSKAPTFEPVDRFGDPFSNRISPSPLQLKNPASLTLDAEIDTSMNYTIYERIGDVNYRPTTTMTFEEFSKWKEEEMLREYWRSRSRGLDGESAVSGRRLIPKLYTSPLIDRIFGGSYVDIQPNGFVTLDFGGRWQRIDNPQIPIRQQRNGGFEFNQQISLNLVGKVGDKLAITANFDNNNSFDFQNNLKMEYTGYEEDIIKKIEVGNVSMPISNSLISGGQSLFGVKTQLQFGKLFVTSVVSRQQGRNDVITLESGFQGREFEVRGSDYDDNRHFFLGHFFRDNYEKWLGSLPQVISGVNVTRVEIYVLKRNGDTQTLRSLLAFQDLGESDKVYRKDNPLIGTPRAGYPASNDANGLFESLKKDPSIRDANQVDGILESGYNFQNSVDYVKITSARRLDEKEFVLNKQLGYISLLRKLTNDEVLAVAYEYTYNGRTFKVGELMEDYQNLSESELLLLKMLRPNKINTSTPTWDLMMKNIYNLNASQVDREGFTLRIHYRDDLTGIDNPSLHEGALTKDQPLIHLLKLDQLNPNNDPQRDGNFDYIDGVTIDSRNGNIIFPVLEPFGKTLKSYFDKDNEQNLIQKYAYDTLYRTTKADAEQVSSKNKFFILGKFQAGASNEIVLPGISISPNSVVVTAGNTLLTEGLDYTVDYNLGRVRIINEGILNSGKQINISYEKADVFNFQTRWLTGTRFDYKLTENLNLGATWLHLNERPGGITRYSVGNEPTKNSLYGFDLNWSKESRFLTKMVDALPFVDTKEPSRITFTGEVAQINPGTSNEVGGEGTSYIDDFESAVTPYNMGNFQAWKLGATPQTPGNRFDLSNQTADKLGSAFKRAKIAWYVIDNVFYRNGGPNSPPNITEKDKDNHYVAGIIPQEIYSQRSRNIVNTNEPIFDIAYFPSERGQYNYNPDLDTDGLLKNPESNWGGITRAITSDVDFDKTNVEYIEFWMLDPFIDDNDGRGKVLDGLFNQANTTGGELIFNLGSVSEDIIKDGLHGFENGLPADGGVNKVTTTEWGKVTQQQYLTDYFDNEAYARPNQDVGLDGLKNSEEASFFNDRFLSQLQVSGTARNKILEDPSGDNFQYYLGAEQDARDAKILERYKNYNGMDGNTPIQTASGENFTPLGSNLPENEDLNKDNTINELEEYYEYKIPLKKGQLEVGKGYIVDRVVGGEGGERTWYLFRIPVRNPSRIQGDISGFKSIKYMRMYLTGWRQPVVLRMSKFQLVGSQWRKFTESLYDRSYNEVPEQYSSDFTISVVSIEENSKASEGKSPYTLPPGINRDRDNTTVIQRENNEQSIQVCVDNLEDRDARAIFKNVNFDLINYGKIKMFLHAEGDGLNDDDVSGFIRFGTDFDQNYYEIEVPLKVTPSNVEGSSGEALQRLVWPAENEIDIEFNQLYAVKSARNRAKFNVELPYTEQVGNYKVTIVGRPDMSSVLTMMIGVKNPESPDQQPKSVCIWANELRVTDFDNTKGWAANTRLNAQLADFATVSGSARITTVGFGGIQQRISERTREETISYDVSANVNVDKLLPGNTGIKIPMFASYENTVATPKWDPLDPDIPLEASLLSIDTQEGQDNYRQIVVEQATRRSLNFTNVRKERVNPDARQDFYDVENFSVNYSYSDVMSSNVNTESYLLKNYRGGVGYNYSTQGLVLEPFKNSEALKSPYLKFIKDINVSPLPNNISIRGDLDRRFARTQLRNANLTTVGLDPFYEKYFTFSRMYSVRWSVFKSLTLDYNAKARAIIDEPEGDISTQAAKDSIWTNLKNLGRMKNFDQNASANYRLPFDKFPVTDWVSADLRYAVGYTWTAGSVTQADTLGNLIQNTRERALNGKVDLVGLYNKVPYFKTINAPPRRRPTGPAPKGPRTKVDTTEAKKSENKAFKGLLRLLMSVRSINGTYSIREGTMLPGFRPRAYLFGLDSGFNAPGTDFIFGSQDPSIRYRAAENGWIAKSTSLSAPFTQNNTTDLQLRANIEPFTDLKIQLDAKKTVTGNFQEIYRYDDELETFRSLTPSRSGSYNISILTINTAFIKDDTANISSVFKQFENNRAIIKSRLDASNSAGEYALNSQDVLIPAFLAAYTGHSANDASLSPFPRIPIPNWRVDYAGLSRIPKLAQVFSSINLTHAYTSSLSINNFSNTLAYTDSLSPLNADNFDLTNQIENYPMASLNGENGLIPIYVLGQVLVSERFAPFLGINIRTKSRVTARIEYKKERNLALNLSNSQVTELKSNDVTLDYGVTKSDYELPFKVQGRTVTLKNDITFRVAVTVRDTKTLQRKIDDEPTITAGNINYQVRPTVSYMLNDQLNLQFYFERNLNQPRISSSFKRVTTAFGVQLRFSLAQ